MDLDEAKHLAIQLNAGALPVPLRTIQTSEVDATLGETDARPRRAGGHHRHPRRDGVHDPVLPAARACSPRSRSSRTSSIVMMIFKLGPVIGPVTITLAGIAGFVLSVGMAVDANILVFERMKEELRAGRNLASAIEHGFDRAWSSIRDSNVSTLITCAILWWFGDQFNASAREGLRAHAGHRRARQHVLRDRRDPHASSRCSSARRSRATCGSSRRTSAIAPGVGRTTPFACSTSSNRRWLYFGISALILVPGLISLADTAGAQGAASSSAAARPSPSTSRTRA